MTYKKVIKEMKIENPKSKEVHGTAIQGHSLRLREKS